MSHHHHQHNILRTKKGPLTAIATDKHVVVHGSSPDIKSSFSFIDQEESRTTSCSLSNNNFVTFNTRSNLILCYDGTVVDVDAREELFVVPFLQKRGPTDALITSIALSKDDQCAFAVGENGTVCCFEVSPKPTRDVFVIKNDEVATPSRKDHLPFVQASNDGRLLIAGNTLFKISCSSNTDEESSPLTKLHCILDDSTQLIGAVFSHDADNKKLFAISARMLYVIDTETGKQTESFNLIPDNETAATTKTVSLTISNDDSLLAVALDNDEIVLVDLSAGADKMEFHRASPLNNALTPTDSAGSLEKIKSSFCQLAFHPSSDGHILASFNQLEGKLRIWHSHVGDVAKLVEIGMSSVMHRISPISHPRLSFSNDGMYLLISNGNADILRFSFVIGVPLPHAKAQLCEENVSHMMFSSHCGSLDVVDANGKVYNIQLEGFLAQLHVQRAEALHSKLDDALKKEKDFSLAVETASTLLKSLEPFSVEALLARSIALCSSSTTNTSTNLLYALLDAKKAVKLSSNELVETGLRKKASSLLAGIVAIQHFFDACHGHHGDNDEKLKKVEKMKNDMLEFVSGL